MSDKFTAKIKNETDLGVDSAGEIKDTIGYTSSKSPDKDELGHYVFRELNTIDVENKYCYAKKIIIKKENGGERYKYFVKFGIDGAMFDPWGMFSEGTQDRYAKRYGKSQWSFREVNEKCFSFYNKFLQSRNKAWLTNAEREVR